jgi:hypothetical protein
LPCIHHRHMSRILTVSDDHCIVRLSGLLEGRTEWLTLFFFFFFQPLIVLHAWIAAAHSPCTALSSHGSLRLALPQWALSSSCTALSKLFDTLPFPIILHLHKTNLRIIFFFFPSILQPHVTLFFLHLPFCSAQSMSNLSYRLLKHQLPQLKMPMI